MLSNQGRVCIPFFAKGEPTIMYEGTEPITLSHKTSRAHFRSPQDRALCMQESSQKTLLLNKSCSIPQPGVEPRTLLINKSCSIPKSKSHPYHHLSALAFGQRSKLVPTQTPQEAVETASGGFARQVPTFHRSRRDSICFRHVHLPLAQVYCGMPPQNDASHDF